MLTEGGGNWWAMAIVGGLYWTCKEQVRFSSGAELRSQLTWLPVIPRRPFIKS